MLFEPSDLIRLPSHSIAHRTVWPPVEDGRTDPDQFLAGSASSKARRNASARSIKISASIPTSSFVHDRDQIVRTIGAAVTYHHKHQHHCLSSGARLGPRRTMAAPRFPIDLGPKLRLNAASAGPTRLLKGSRSPDQLAEGCRGQGNDERMADRLEERAGDDAG